MNLHLSAQTVAKLQPSCLHLRIQGTRLLPLSAATQCWHGHNHPKSSHKFISTNGTQHKSETKDNDQISSGTSAEKYSTFYRFPHITFVRAISRLKIYQTGITVVALPPAFHLYTLGQLSDLTLLGFTGISAFAGIMLYIISSYSRKLVGLMALSEDNRTLRVAQLTFWGNRKNVYIPVESLVPLCDLPDNPSDAYIKLRCYDREDFMYLTLKYGTILDLDKFKYALGELI